MKIEHIRNLSGPNLYTPHPALIARLNPAFVTNLKTSELANFNNKLLAVIPGLQKHHCDLGRAGGFVQRLAEGLFFSHVVEHVAAEMSHLADCGISVSCDEVCETERKPDCAHIVVEYISAAGMELLLETAVEIVARLETDKPLESITSFVSNRLAETRSVVAGRRFEGDTREIVMTARERNIPVQHLGKNCLQLGYGKNRRLITDDLNGENLLHTAKLTGNSETAQAVIENFYQHNADSRIPLISVTGTNAKTTVTRMVGHIFAEAGKRVGMTTTDGIWIGDECIEKGDTTRPKSASKVLTNPTVEIAVLETARGGILRRGLGYDWSDVSVITNIQADHIGQDGIKNVADILQIKSLVAEGVRAGGTLVLNADDEVLMRLVNEPRINQEPKEIVYFSLKPNHITVKRHTLAGGTAYTVRNGWLIEVSRSELQIAQIAEIPATFGGFAEFNVANALAATAVCRAQRLTIEQIAAGLLSFQPEQHNHGRTNLFEVDGAYVFLDYGHNPEAFKSVCKMTANWEDGGRRRITAIIGVPGDRADSLALQAGRIAARGFHRVVIREDGDLRGRAAGEMAQILSYAVKSENPACDCQIILSEAEALKREITRLQRGDILVCFYEKYDLVRDILAKCEAQPTSCIDNYARYSFPDFRQA